MDPAIYLSIFGAITATGLVLVGYKVGTIETRQKNQEAKDFVPRTEFDMSLKNIEGDIKEIKDDIREFISSKINK